MGRRMSDVLFIKTSSLGDVIHHMPALTEAKSRRPDTRFRWVVEEAFAPLVRLHPMIDEVIPVAARQWRQAMNRPGTWRAFRQFRHDLRQCRYDAIVDTQGLVKSALMAHLASGRRHGYDLESIREPVASWFYDVRHRVAWQQHAIIRNRALTGLALGYEPSGEPDYGLDRERLAVYTGAPYAVLLHATARPSKQWSQQNWRTLAIALGSQIEVVLPYGTDAERARSEAIAQDVARPRVPARMPIDAMARLIAGASFVVGVDTGLLHLAAALGVPLVAIFVDSDPGMTGPMGTGPIVVLGHDRPASVADVLNATRQIKP
jgi:heptosyltransferase-1